MVRSATLRPHRSLLFSLTIRGQRNSRSRERGPLEDRIPRGRGKGDIRRKSPCLRAGEGAGKELESLGLQPCLLSVFLRWTVIVLCCMTRVCRK